jgi:hypothetical protein
MGVSRRWRRTAAPLLRSKLGVNSDAPFTPNLAFRRQSLSSVVHFAKRRHRRWNPIPGLHYGKAAEDQKTAALQKLAPSRTPCMFASGSRTAAFTPLHRPAIPRLRQFFKEQMLKRHKCRDPARRRPGRIFLSSIFLSLEPKRGMTEIWWAEKFPRRVAVLRGGPPTPRKEWTTSRRGRTRLLFLLANVLTGAEGGDYRHTNLTCAP